MATIRPARATDLDQIDPLIVSSINGLTEAHGFGKIASPSPPLFQAFSLADDPDGLWVAESEWGIVGTALSWTCDDLWFLAQLFVAPQEQAAGLGSELLARTLDHADHRRATKKALITFAFNRASQGLYLRHGLYPYLPINMMRVPRDRLNWEAIAEGLVATPITELNEASLLEIDRAAAGVSRVKHHRNLSGLGDVTGYALTAGTEVAGYAYVSNEGHIGPLAVLDPAMMEPAFATALRIASKKGTGAISALVPGGQHAALRLAVKAGMRISLPMVVMADHDPGGWPSYMPRNPGFM